MAEGIRAKTNDEQWRTQAKFNEDMKHFMNDLEVRFDELCNQVGGLRKGKATMCASLNADLPILSPVTKGFSVMEAAANGSNKGKELTHEDLQLLTNNFSPHNYFGRTHFGVLYRGIIPEGWKGMRSGEATIKIWKNEQFIADDFGRLLKEDPVEVRFRMEQEIRFLQQTDIAMHPYTVNVMGYCFEDNNLGVVYDLKPLQTLRNYIDNENFGWLKRVKVALKLAYLLKFFHENVPLYIVRNLSAAHVMLDQDLNPVLIDYAMIHGGSYVDRRPLEWGAPTGSWGYVDLDEISIFGKHSQSTDIYAYGVILLELIGRCGFDDYQRKLVNGPLINMFAWEDYMRQTAKHEKYGNGEFCYSFAHQYLRDDPDYDARDGNKISMLAFKCCVKVRRPRGSMMGEVMKELKELKVVESHPELLDEEKQ